MEPAQNHEIAGKNRFGGCKRLHSQYRVIGLELMRFERSSASFKLSFSGSTTERDFQVGVSFVPVEVLESYLEDLLEPSIPDRSLFLRRGMLRLSVPQAIGFAALFFVCGAGAVLYGGDATLVALGISIAFFALVASVLLPRHKLLRRIRFANLVSREISRRRGDSGSGKIRRFPSRVIFPNPTDPAVGAC